MRGPLNRGHLKISMSAGLERRGNSCEPESAGLGSIGGAQVRAYEDRIPFGDHPLKLERYREDYHGPCARMTRINREV